jgi:hypothetical protein
MPGQGDLTVPNEVAGRNSKGACQSGIPSGRPGKTKTNAVSFSFFLADQSAVKPTILVAFPLVFEADPVLKAAHAE